MVLGVAAQVSVAGALTDPRDVLALRTIRAEVEGRDIYWAGAVAEWEGDDPCGDSWEGEWEGISCRGQPTGPGVVRRVTNFHLPDRGLTGPVPRSLALLTALTEIDLDSNALSGPLPPELGCLTALREMDLANNPGITGRIPPEWGRLQALEELEFELNSGMSGCLPRGVPAPARFCGVGCVDFSLDPVVGTSTRGSGIRPWPCRSRADPFMLPLRCPAPPEAPPPVEAMDGAMLG
ncbi:unnamed protein product [Pedinophyceae sp. YPF-701]|nr:unnamed protein product [Pedinophyceae sp. YPF-701]